MKHITIITALLMTFATQSMAVSGSMTCKVKTSYVVEIEDGIAETFTGYNNGAGVGDTVTLSYIHYNKKGQFVVKIGKGFEKNLSMYPIRASIEPTDRGYERGSSQLASMPREIMESDFNKLVVSTDTLEITSLFRVSYTSFQRYYKNDWQGFVRTEQTANNKFDAHVATLDCRHNNDQLDEFINAMKRAG